MSSAKMPCHLSSGGSSFPPPPEPQEAALPNGGAPPPPPNIPDIPGGFVGASTATFPSGAALQQATWAEFTTTKK